MAHIVRKAWSRRCSKNIHWHSYIVEVFFEWTDFDEGQMLIDFGLVKKYFNDFIDSFDHSFMLWNIDEDKDIIDFSIKNFERVIISPESSSAESQARLFYQVLSLLLLRIPENYRWGNKISKIIIHETKTGYAEFCSSDMQKLHTSYPEIKIFSNDMSDEVINEKNTLWISSQIASEWADKGWLIDYHDIKNHWRIEHIHFNK